MNSKIIVQKDPKSPIAEVFRTLRTNIKFASFEKEVKTIVFTSSGPNEGKSTISANLAVTLSHAGSRVLVMEGDLRNPTVHKIFGLSNLQGLTNILISNENYKNYIQQSSIKNLSVITSGPKPPNPAELLGSFRIRELISQVRNDYDYVLIDAPPVVVVTDAALLASICDGVVLVIGSGEAIIEGVVKARDLLLNVKANIIGTVLNKCKDSKLSGYYYKYYYEDDKDNRKRRPSASR